jgi:hypothetical protein
MSEKLKILEMLDQGTITIQEANQLLEAAQDDTPQPAGESADAPAAPPPNMHRFRLMSYIPFGVSLLLLLLTGWGVFALSRRADGRITFGFVALVILLVLLVFTTLLTHAMTRMPWLHVRVQTKNKGAPDGKTARRRLFISLPVPLALAQWGLRIAHRYVSEEQAAYMDTAAALIQSAKRDLGKPGSDPIIVDVDDEDERVQIYIG